MNSKRGGVTFQALDQEFTLRVGMNAMCDYQDKTGVKFIVGLSAVEKEPDNMIGVRSLFAACLYGHDEEVAGDVIDDIGLQSAFTRLTEAVALAFPNDDAETVGNAKAGKPAKKLKPTT